MLKSSHVDDDVQISASDAFYEMDCDRVVQSEKCWIGIEEKMPEISREVNFLERLGNFTCLTTLEGEMWKCTYKVVMDDEN